MGQGKLQGNLARRTSVAVPVEAGAATSKEDRLENLLWFAIVSPGRVWLFRAVNLEDLERWMYSMEDRCNEFKQQMSNIKMAIKQAEKVPSFSVALFVCLSHRSQGFRQ